MTAFHPSRAESAAPDATRIHSQGFGVREKVWSASLRKFLSAWGGGRLLLDPSDGGEAVIADVKGQQFRSG
jgi:hypothetical protein